MVFSMNLFKNKKRWQNKKNVKKRALNKKRKKRFYIYACYGDVAISNNISNNLVTILYNRKLYLTYGMVLCLVTLTDL